MAREHSAWRTWLRQPQRLKLRRLLFQVHRWTAISLGLYILFISLSGSVLVYRNELYVAATPEPVISTASGPMLSDPQLSDFAERAHPGYSVRRLHRPSNPDQAVVIWLARDDELRKRLFDPRTGEDVGPASPLAMTLITGLMELHADFLSGSTGRTVNGFVALGVLLILLTGLVIWWPGINRWRRSLVVHRGIGWKRQVWDVHSMVGIWTYAFMLTFVVSGLYLCFAPAFHGVADWIQPVTDENAGTRLVDRVLYWLAFLHFGRINGIGIPCDGPGLCDQGTKAAWALFGLAPAVMIVTGATMWWNRQRGRRNRVREGRGRHRSP